MSNETLSTTSKIFDAFSKAQADFPSIEKNCKVDVFSKPPNRQLLYTYYYADLTEIISKTRPSLSKNGLSFSQGMSESNTGFCTKIMHSSGESFESGLILTQVKANDYKEMGGAMTYLKRISLSAALGIVADEDVDAAQSEAQNGNSTSKSEKAQNGTYNPRARPLSQFTSPNQPKPQNPLDSLFSSYARMGVEKGHILDFFGYATVEQISPNDIDKLRNIWKQLVAKEVTLEDLFFPPQISHEQYPQDDFDQFMDNHGEMRR